MSENPIHRSPYLRGNPANCGMGTVFLSHNASSGNDEAAAVDHAMRGAPAGSGRSGGSIRCATPSGRPQVIGRAGGKVHNQGNMEAPGNRKTLLVSCSKCWGGRRLTWSETTLLECPFDPLAWQAYCPSTLAHPSSKNCGQPRAAITCRAICSLAREHPTWPNSPAHSSVVLGRSLVKKSTRAFPEAGTVVAPSRTI